jgi:hypothetical protein
MKTLKVEIEVQPVLTRTFLVAVSDEFPLDCGTSVALQLYEKTKDMPYDVHFDFAGSSVRVVKEGTPELQAELVAGEVVLKAIATTETES